MTNPATSRLRDKLFGMPGTAGSDNKSHLLHVALHLLADGEPITPTQLARAAGVSEVDLEHGTAGKDIEYDDQGRIVGWGLTRNPTPHKFSIDGKQLYTWCAPDTLLFPAVIGRSAEIESLCMTTGTIIRLSIDPDIGITDLEPSTTVVSIVSPNQIDPVALRATACNLQHFFADAEAAREWQSRYPGMRVLPVPQAYALIMLSFADAIPAEFLSD